MFEIDPKLLLDWLKDNSPWFVPVALFLFFLLKWWGKLNWEALNGREKKPESYAWAIKQLKENNWGKLYLNSLGWVLEKISNWIGDREKLNQIYVTPANPKGIIHKTFGFNPFTPESYDKCLRLAFLYPVLSFFIAWAIGGSAQIGGMNFLGEAIVLLEIWQRWLFLVSVVIVFFLSALLLFHWKAWMQWLNLVIILFLTSGMFSLLLSEEFWGVLISVLIRFGELFFPMYLAGWLISRFFYFYSSEIRDAVYPIAFTFSFIFSVSGVVVDSSLSNYSIYELISSGIFIHTFSFITLGGVVGAGAGSIIEAFIFTVSMVFAISMVGNGAVFGISAMVFVAFFVGSNWFNVSSDGIILINALAFSIAAVIMVLFKVVQKWSGDKENGGWFFTGYSLLFIVLGYFSLYHVSSHSYMLLLLLWLVLPLVNAPLDWLSLGVTRGLLQAARARHHGGWSALGFGLLDLGFALGFLFLIAAALVLATALGNVVAGQTLVDLGVIFTELRADPWSVNHWWVYFMLLSTLVPTLVHFALAGGAATLWLPQKLRERIAHNLEQNHYKISAAWVYLTFTPAIGFVVAPALLLGLLYWLVTAHGGWFGGHLLDWAEWLALSVNPPVSAGAQP